MQYTVALFGEAGKGEFRQAYFCRSLPQLFEAFGNPPSDSQGLRCAIQALFYEREILFFRVKEEGFSLPDYLAGLHALENKKIFSSLTALCLPGVGDPEIIQAAASICLLHKSLLVTTERDLYDYLTARSLAHC